MVAKRMLMTMLGTTSMMQAHDDGLEHVVADHRAGPAHLIGAEGDDQQGRRQQRDDAADGQEDEEHDEQRRHGCDPADELVLDVLQLAGLRR